MMGFGMQWHQLDHMQTFCTSFQADNHNSTPQQHLITLLFTCRMLFLTPNSVKELKETDD